MVTTMTRIQVALSLAVILPTLAIGCMDIDSDDAFRGTPVEEDDGGEPSDEGGEPSDEGVEPSDEGGEDEGGEPSDEGGEDEGGDEGVVCEEQLETDLKAGQHFDTGSVTVANDEDEILIGVDTASPYLLAEVHIYVGTDPVPTNGAGNPSPGQFPYSIEFPEPVASHDLAVPLAELGVGCDDQLHVAVHAVVVSFDEQGNEVFEETAWGFGEDRFEGMRWGWSFDYGICC